MILQKNGSTAKIVSYIQTNRFWIFPKANVGKKNNNPTDLSVLGVEVFASTQ